MPNGDTVGPVVRPQVIADRIGPIFDPAFLKLIPRDKLRDITVIQLRAQVSAMKMEAEAAEQIVKEIEQMRF